MKRVTAILLALLLGLCCAAFAEENANIEVIRVDGVSVIVLTPNETAQFARMMFMAKAANAGFVLPQSLTIIGEEAFADIAAEGVDVTENVVSIESRAFADCVDLREITIPATVLSIDDHALDGCGDVTVYGAQGSEAERFAHAAGFAFVDPDAEPATPAEPAPVMEAAAAELPFVPAD